MEYIIGPAYMYAPLKGRNLLPLSDPVGVSGVHSKSPLSQNKPKIHRHLHHPNTKQWKSNSSVDSHLRPPEES